MPRPGFTLVELLVVVAIFGILSSFGIIAYQIYITSAKDEVGISNANDMSRMLQIDHTAITTGITARSDLAEGLTTTNLCREQADKIVYEINTVQGKTNQHNADCGVAFNGNRAWSLNNLDSVNNVDYFDGRSGDSEQRYDLCAARPHHGGLCQQYRNHRQREFQNLHLSL